MTEARALEPLRRSDEKFCFSCGRTLHASAVACPSCGANQTATSVAQVAVAGRPPFLSGGGLDASNAQFCYGCGTRMHVAAFACPTCGAVQHQQRRRGNKDRTVAIVLAFLLGGVGGHRFYLGSIGLGLLYLVFCWTFIPAIVAMIEGVIFISTSDAQFQRRYC